MNWALVVLALVALFSLGLGLKLLRTRDAGRKIATAQSADMRRLAATSDPVRRAKLERRMAIRMKEE